MKNKTKSSVSYVLVCDVYVCLWLSLRVVQIYSNKVLKTVITIDCLP